jgi:hypothetical protein
MVFFRVTDNINIKTTDGTLVKYNKYKFAVSNETAYLTTLDDFDDLQEVLSNVDKEKFVAKPLIEEKFRSQENFPIELGISNAFEYDKYKSFQEQIGDSVVINKQDVENMFFTSKKVDLLSQLKNLNKDEISIAIIGKLGNSISEMTASCAALKILYSKLNEIYKTVHMDLYINASNNSYFTRDKQIFETQEYLRAVLPLSITVKRLCNYDYYVDNSSFFQRSALFDSMNIVDVWLSKFGLDPKKITDIFKHNEMTLDVDAISNTLKEKLSNIKKSSKILMYHPYSVNLEKSIPQEYAVNYLKELIEQQSDYIIVSSLKIDAKLNDDRYVELSKESKTYNDFVFIVSNADKIVTVDTCTYHIADSFLIPTVVITKDEDIKIKTKYYNYVKSFHVKDETKKISKLIFENDNLTFYRFESWKKLQTKEIIKVLESF